MHSIFSFLEGKMKKLDLTRLTVPVLNLVIVYLLSTAVDTN
eukprot:SAG11_NODE_2466_length_3324_cov_1.192558_4_plen_41_part_00